MTRQSHQSLMRLLFFFIFLFKELVYILHAEKIGNINFLSYFSNSIVDYEYANTNQSGCDAGEAKNVADRAITPSGHIGAQPVFAENR